MTSILLFSQLLFPGMYGPYMQILPDLDEVVIEGIYQDEDMKVELQPTVEVDFEDPSEEFSEEWNSRKLIADRLKKRSKKPETGIINSWFFDTRVDWFSNNRWEGHCTQYAAWYRWKHFGISIPWRGNWWEWFANAQAFDRPTGDEAELWAIMVYDAWIGIWSDYGHVWIIVKIDRDHNMVLLEDMNYLWTHEASHHWVSMDDSAIVGYIYRE